MKFFMRISILGILLKLRKIRLSLFIKLLILTMRSKSVLIFLSKIDKNKINVFKRLETSYDFG